MPRLADRPSRYYDFTLPSPQPSDDRFVEVALPVPLDRAFTYRVDEAEDARPGTRVVAPWGNQRLIGVVLRQLDQPPDIPQQIKSIDVVLDREPVLDSSLIELALWSASYYQAPIGEVFRTTLPPAADVRLQNRIRITAAGEELLSRGSTNLFGEVSVARSSGGGNDRAMQSLLVEVARGRTSLESALGKYGARAVRQVLRESLVTIDISGEAMEQVRVNRIVRLAADADARVATAKRVTPQQQRAVELLREAGGELLATDFKRRASASAIRSLQAHGVIQVAEVEALPQAPEWAPRSRVERLNDDQQTALDAITASLHARIAEAGKSDRVSTYLLHGVTGSGKTAVYIRAIDAARTLGLGALVLVPEIGLTSAVFADVADAFPG